MSKDYVPRKSNNYLFKKKYRVNKNYNYDYDQLTSLVNWWDYLDHAHYRYRYVFFTLNYNDSKDHNPENISKYLHNISRGFKSNDGHKIPIHYVWKLEHRQNKDPSKPMGYHYHVVVCFSREVSRSTKKFRAKLRKSWKHGSVYISKTYASAYKVSSITVKKKDGRKQKVKLPYPIYNTQTEHYAGLFHHFSYLAKKDPKQALPSDYSGNTFKTSQFKPERLTQHPSIIKRNNTIRLEPPALEPQKDIEQYEDIPTDDGWSSELPF